MTQMERSLSQGKDIDSWYLYIVNKMKGRKYITTDKGELWFLDGDGAFHICQYESPLYGFIIEYAEGRTADKMGWLRAETCGRCSITIHPKKCFRQC